MTTVTQKPAQTALAGAKGRAPASPSTSSPSQSGAPAEAGAPVGRAPSSRARSGRGTAKTYPCARKIDGCVHRGCGGHNRAGGPCGKGRGQGTDHPGSGNCNNHRGQTPSGRVHAQREQAAASLASLAIPADGDPLEVLQATVEAAHGVMLAGRQLLVDGKTEAAVKLYVEAIERAARVAKHASEAFNLDDLVRIRERETDLLEKALMRALERAGIPDRRRRVFLGYLREELATVASGEDLN